MSRQWILRTRGDTSESPLALCASESIDQTVLCHHYSAKRGARCCEVLKDDDPMNGRDTSALSELPAMVAWKRSQNARPIAHPLPAAGHVVDFNFTKAQAQGLRPFGLGARAVELGVATNLSVYVSSHAHWHAGPAVGTGSSHAQMDGLVAPKAPDVCWMWK